MKRTTIEHFETGILDLIQTKSKMKSVSTLDWTVENTLNNLMIDELSKLKKFLLKKRRTEPKPILFAIPPPQQPPTPIELDF